MDYPFLGCNAAKINAGGPCHAERHHSVAEGDAEATNLGKPTFPTVTAVLGISFLVTSGGHASGSAGPPRQPSRDRLSIAGVRLAEQPPERRLLIVPHEEVVADRHEGGVAEQDDHPAQQCFADYDQHHAHVLRVADVAVQTGDDQLARRVVEGRRAAAAANEIGEADAGS